MTDLCVEFLCLLVSRGRGANGVSFNNESFDGFSEIRYHVRDVTLGDVVLCRGVKDLAELELARVAGGRWSQKSERFLRFTCGRVPVCFFRLMKVR